VGRELKAKVDELNAWYSEESSFQPTEFTAQTASIHFYSGMVVVERAPMEMPRLMAAGDAGVTYPSAEPILDAVRRPH
jgi:hypothetical protein